MAIAYPATLPPPMQDGYQLRHVSSRRATAMASGRTRLRRTHSSTPSEITLTWQFTGAELEQFEQWFYDNLFQTDEWFTAPLQTSGGVEYIEVRFMAMYQKAPTGPRDWQVTASLETRERHTVAEDWLEPLASIIPYFSIIDIAANREWPAE